MNIVPFPKKDARTIIGDFIRERFETAEMSNAYLGLSGGVDSALALGLLTEVLGAENVHPLFLPYGPLSGRDREYAEKTADTFGTELIEIDITDIVDSIPMDLEGMALGNLQARIRMMILFAYTNANGGLVVGPSNKTEILMGYFTKFGDGAADLHPLGDLYKTQVRALAEEVGVPQAVLKRPPSANLVKDQTDEGELGIPYSILDQVLYGYIRGLTPGEIADSVDITRTNPDEMDRSGFSPPLEDEEVMEIIDTVERARHKRAGLVVPKLEPATPGFDLRERW